MNVGLRAGVWHSFFKLRQFERPSEMKVVHNLKLHDHVAIQTKLQPTVIHSAQYSTVEDNNVIVCLAISPDDGRVFSCGCSQRVLVHDIQRYVLE
jgi:hypothetical protein